MSRIAYFGPQGTFTEQAALNLVDAVADELVPVDTVTRITSGLLNLPYARSIKSPSGVTARIRQ